MGVRRKAPVTPPPRSPIPHKSLSGHLTFVLRVAHQQVLQQECRLDLEFLHVLLHSPHEHREAIQAEELQQPSLLLSDET